MKCKKFINYNMPLRISTTEKTRFINEGNNPGMEAKRHKECKDQKIVFFFSENERIKKAKNSKIVQ